MVNNSFSEMPLLAYSANDIISRVLTGNRRVLLFGPPGVGKSTLAMELGRTLNTTGRHCWCLSADPGSPAFGIPGAVSLGRWAKDTWQVEEYEGLCTLDAGRFRLPLVSAVRQLAREPHDGVVLIDGPGVVRGVAGRELLMGLVEAGEIDAVLAITAAVRSPPLLDELRALPVDVVVVQADEQARRLGKRVRARVRTAQWDAYLAQTREHTIDLAWLNLVGTPPPL